MPTPGLILDQLPGLSALGRDLALAERILRRSFGADSRTAVLGCLAGELADCLPHRCSWLAEVDLRVGEARITEFWPCGADPPSRVLPCGPEPCQSLAGGPGAVWCASHSSAPHQCALADMGIHSHVTLGPVVADPPLLLTFAAPPGMVYDAEHLVRADEVAPAAAAALSLCPPGPPAPLVAGGGLDALEMMEYVSGAVAHDVRNVMAGIIGAVELHLAARGSDDNLC